MGGVIEKEVLIIVCWFPVNLNAKVSVFFNVDCAVQKGPAVFFYIFLCEFDIYLYMGGKCVQFFCLNLDPGVIQVSESVT